VVVTGAVVTARTGKAAQMRNVRSGTSYISQDDMRLHFGLGQAAVVDSLEVLWPDGKTTKLEEVKADQVLEVPEP
jgi:enediyne biosynthesis protein E4